MRTLALVGTQSSDEPVGEVAAESLLEPTQRGLPLVGAVVERLYVGKEPGRAGRCVFGCGGGAHAPGIGASQAERDPWRE